MNQPELEVEASEIVEVNTADRWQVYLRLQELEIPCKCAPNQPLTVKVNSPTAAIQLWSIVRQLNAPRKHSVGWLKYCWQLCSNPENDKF